MERHCSFRVGFADGYLFIDHAAWSCRAWPGWLVDILERTYHISRYKSINNRIV